MPVVVQVPLGRVVQLGAGRERCPALCLPRPAPCRWAAASPCGVARRVQRAGRASSVPLAGVVQLGAGNRVPLILSPPSDQHLAVGQQRRRVLVARGAQRAGRSPRPVGRDRTAPRWPEHGCRACPRDQHLAIGQQRRRVVLARVFSEPVAVQVPVAGSYSSALASAMPQCRPRPAPCRWAATSPCATVRAAGQRAGRRPGPAWPDRTARHCPDLPLLAASPRTTSTLPLGSNVAVWIIARGSHRSRSSSRSRWPDRTAPRWQRVPPMLYAPRDQHLAIGQQRRRV